MKKSILFLLLSVLFFSCANQFSLQKRRYTKGFYFAHSHHNHQANNNTSINKTAQANITIMPEKKVVEVVPPPAVNSENTVEGSQFTQKAKIQSTSLLHNTLPKVFKKSILKIKTKMFDVKHPKSFKKATTQVVKQSILKRVIRKILRKLGFLLITIGGIIYGVGILIEGIQPLGILFVVVGVFLIIIAILTRLT